MENYETCEDLLLAILTELQKLNKSINGGV